MAETKKGGKPPKPPGEKWVGWTWRMPPSLLERLRREVPPGKRSALLGMLLDTYLDNPSAFRDFASRLPRAEEE